MSIRSETRGSAQRDDDVASAAAVAAPPFDLLTDVMEQVRLEGTVYFSAELHAPYGIAIDRPHRSPFYIGLEGECQIQVGRGKVHVLGPRDVALLPNAAAHVVRSDRDARVVPFDDWLATHPMDARGFTLHRGPGKVRRVIGGFFSTDSLRLNPLFSALPPIILLRGTDPDVQRWLEPTVNFICAEVEAGLQGSRTVLRRMADVLFIQSLRAYAARNRCAAGWLRGLGDPRVAKALTLMHQRYADPWTLDSLAHEVGTSRTALAVRFRELVGEPPMAYLTRWRVTRAASQLRSERTPLARVAEGVGYQSDAVFSKAFRRVTGVSPGRYRRDANGAAVHG
jgi:AraC-like DNA-binding protein